jgi:prepilin-type N-terminal cleavage/methylation domain-containing protein
VKRHTSAGFSLIELLIVIAISIVLAGIAIPVFTSAIKSYNQTATVSAATGAIESTRFQAIMHGCPYQIVFTASTLSYQVYSELPPTGTAGCLASFSPVPTSLGGGVIPLPAAGGVVMNGVNGGVAVNTATFTYTFFANGVVTATAGQPSMQIYIPHTVLYNTITVSGVGNVSTSRP